MEEMEEMEKTKATTVPSSDDQVFSTDVISDQLSGLQLRDGLYNSKAVPKSVIPDVTKYKSKHCRNFMSKGHCDFGNSCIFAHGDHDVQKSNSNPKFETGGQDLINYKTKICKHFANNAACPFMDRCGFAHGPQDLNTAARRAPGTQTSPIFNT